MADIKFRVQRGLWFHGRQFASGDTLIVTPAEAIEVLAAGRAELVDPLDQALVEAARQSARARLIASMPVSRSPFR